jgi:enamine deaminase RidA (YjgF/YER057c/UK114 family)/GNAT superfamily N-acetyltransferase
MRVRRWPARAPGRSRAVACNGLVWVVANATDGHPQFDVQVEQSLARLDGSLREAGSDRSHLLSLQVILADIDNRARFEEHWQAWIGTDPMHWPQRACFQSALAPGLQIELVAVAALATDHLEAGGAGQSSPAATQGPPSPPADPVTEAERGGYEVSTDRSRLDLAAVHRFLSTSYWSPGLPLDVLTRAVVGSLCFGLYKGGEQVGFARVVTDRATFAYLCDVYVLEAHRGRGLGRWLMEVVAAHPSLQGLRRFVLVTRDAHGLYERFGFRPLARPEGYMELHRPDAYAQAAGQGNGDSA